MTVTTHIHPARDGTPMAVHETGSGRPLVLIHGLMSNAQVNWIKYGHAAQLAAAGFRVIMPDLRAHGQSGAPHDPALYPKDILLDDVQGIIAALALEDYDLGGFSLGARLTAMLIADGARPRRAILSGMGLDGLIDWQRRRAFFLKAIARKDEAVRGDRDFMAIQFMKTTKVDTVAIDMLLRSMDDFDVALLDRLTMRTLVLCGEEDRDNGSPDALAERLAHAVQATVPGGHMSCITHKAFGTAMVDFLAS